MKITRRWLENHNACSEGKEWFLSENILDAKRGVENLIAKDRLSWASWLLVRVLTHKQRIAYAIFAAEQVIDIYEKNYPNDKRPRLAIEAAKAVLRRNTKDSMAAARSAAWSAALSAGSAAWSAAWAAESAAKSAGSAAWSAAWSVARSAEAAEAAGSAAESARSATEAAWSAMLTKILHYGLSLLKEGK